MLPIIITIIIIYELSNWDGSKNDIGKNLEKQTLHIADEVLLVPLFIGKSDTDSNISEYIV